MGLLLGTNAPQAIFEVVGRIGQVCAEKQELPAQYELALVAYRRSDWLAVCRQVLDGVRISSEDGPTLTMLKRIETLVAMPAIAGSRSSVWWLGKDNLP